MVYYAKLISCDDMEVAVKSPIKKEYNIVKEYKILSKMGTHPNIVKLVGIIHNEDYAKRKLILEYTSMGSLHDLLHVKTWVKYNMKHVLAWLIGIAEAIKHMHSFTVPVVHRDIKSGNILLFSK